MNRQDRSLGEWSLDVTHHADCLQALKSVPDNAIDLIVTSPPYWGQRGSSGLGSEADPRVYIERLVMALTEAMRCLNPAGVLFLNLGDAYNTPINWRAVDHMYSSLGKEGDGLKPTNSAYTKNRGRRRAFVDREVSWLQYGNLLSIPYRVAIEIVNYGYLFRGEIIWHKSRPLPEGRCRRPHRHHESIYVFAKSERHRFRTRPPVPSVWQLVQTPNRTSHCSTFPLDLPLHCIDAAALDAGSVVFDPYMGSGTTAEAALMRGHHFLGFEIDPVICNIANDRLANRPVPLPAFDQEPDELVGLRVTQ